MPTYSLNELMEKMAPQSRLDMALIGRCADGLGLYAAKIAEENKTAPKIEELRSFVDKMVGYWGLDSNGFDGALPRDFLRDFDDKVSEVRTGGAVTGDIYQAGNNVICGLHRYGEDMVVSQGRDAMGDILDISDLMKEVTEAWDFEPDVTKDLTARLESEVRRMLDETPLPGQAVVGVVNTGYAITQAVMFENDRGFALAHSPTAPSPFVTWQFTNDGGNLDHYWGHYFGSEDRARIDFVSRAAEHKETYRLSEKPIPTAAVEAVEEQNYNMIDGVDNNAGVPKSDLTDGQTYTEIRELAPETLLDEKPSVLEQIRAAQKAPKQPPKPKPERDKKKTDPEH